jgi:phenylacetate-CoA ligase
MWPILRLLFKCLQQKAVLLKTPEQIRALQQRRLRSLVGLAKSRSPFFAERFQHIDPANFSLDQLPTFTKTDMMVNFDRFLTERDLNLKLADLEEFVSDPARLGRWYLDKYALSHTSGTQGLRAMIVQDRQMMELLFALQMIRGSALTTTPMSIVARLFQRTRLAVVTIGPGFYPSAAALAYAPPAFHTFVRRLWLTHIEPIDEVVAELNQFQPQVLLAYANVLETLAREALAGRLRLARPKGIRQVINMSEPLSEGAHKFIQQAFGLPVTDQYAMGECMALTTPCPLGHGMHLQADWAILEVVDRANRPVAPGTAGDKVLLTNLYNTIQPFIRYEVEDMVTLSRVPCPCGSPLPLIIRVEGRSDELVWIRDGARYRQVHPYVFLDMMDEYPAAGWYQLVQVERNRILIRVAPAPGRQVDVADLRQIMVRGLHRYGLADLIALDIQITDEVAPNPRTGKLKRVMSQVGAPVGLFTQPGLVT